MSVLTEEILSESEIKARYPDQWVLVDILEWDAGFEITRGVVRAFGADREAMHETAMELPRLTPRRKISIFYTGSWPSDQIYLLNNGLFL